MATNPQTTQAEPVSDDHLFDEQTGVYGFFRRHQKKLLYTAGFFTLLTFSITGPLQSFISDIFEGRQEMPSIVVNGDRIKLTSEDYEVANRIARNQFRGLPPGVIVPIFPGEGGDSELADSFAIMRRAAIAEGIGVSLDEVDRALEAERERAKLESVAKLAQQRGFASLAEYRALVAEAMRLGTYTRLQMLSLDSSDAEVMARLTSDREKITFQVATFDEQKRQEELAAASELTDDDLRVWLDGKSDGEKRKMNAFDNPVIRLRFAALLYDEGQFDPAEWQDGPLKDFTVDDAQLQSYYDRFKTTFFAVEDKSGEFQPFEDETVQAKLTRIVQAERVMNELGKARQELAKATEQAEKELARAESNVQAASRDEAEARQQKLTKENELKAKREELDGKPGDETLQAEVAKLEQELAEAEEKLFAAGAVSPAMQNAATEAREAVAEARAQFDFPAAVLARAEGKQGFVIKEMAEKKDAFELKDLDEVGVDLGDWPEAGQAMGLRDRGAVSSGSGITSKAIVLYQAIESDPTPLKAWDELKPLVQDAYWAEKAQKEGIEHRDQLKEALLRLAKEKIPEFIEKLEAERQSRIDERVAEWEQGIQETIAKAERTLADSRLGKRTREVWQNKLDAQRRDLETKETRVHQFEIMVGQDIDKEIREEAKKHYHEVLAAAAAEAGFTVAEYGPYPRDLRQRPGFKHRYDPAVAFLFNAHSELDENEATDVLQDAGERRYYAAVCTEVEPLTPADVTRREFEQLRTFLGQSFATLQARNAQQQAFSKEALAERYDFEQATGRQAEPTASTDSAGDPGEGSGGESGDGK